MKKPILFIMSFITVAFFATVAYCGIGDIFKSIFTAEPIWVGIVTVVLGYILKRIPNEKIQAVVGKFAYGLGVLITLGLSKYKFTKPFWQSIIEPWFIDLFDNTIGTFTRKFIEGLRSDG